MYWHASVWWKPAANQIFSRPSVMIWRQQCGPSADGELTAVNPLFSNHDIAHRAIDDVKKIVALLNWRPTESGSPRHYTVFSCSRSVGHVYLCFWFIRHGDGSSSMTWAFFCDNSVDRSTAFLLQVPFLHSRSKRSLYSAENTTMMIICRSFAAQWRSNEIRWSGRARHVINHFKQRRWKKQQRRCWQRPTNSILILCSMIKFGICSTIQNNIMTLYRWLHNYWWFENAVNNMKRLYLKKVFYKFNSGRLNIKKWRSDCWKPTWWAKNVSAL